uniref:Clathrin assembly family protein n=1 Tax=Rhizophora mucronata TaxID=61149 RepID=A0A2P2NKY6_RHIMU
MGVDIQAKIRLAIGTVKDHASIGRAMILDHEGKGFSNIEIAVVRATGHDHSPIDDNHIHEILFLVSNSPEFVPFLAEQLSRRLGKTKERLVALKTLFLIHRLLRGGNRYFERQLREAHVSGHLQMSMRRFLMNSDSSVFYLHGYAAYLEERIGWVINQAGKLEPVMSHGLEFPCYDEKSIDMIFRKLPKCQVFIDRVLACSSAHILPSYNLAQAAMSNILKESFLVYMTYCEGVTALVNMFFDLTTPARALACQILKRASRQSQELHDFYENCKRNIRNKSLEYPLVQVITMDHVLALEQCCGYTASPKSCSRSNKDGPNPPPILDSLTKSVNLQAGTSTAGRKGEECESNFNLTSSTLFSCTLETKISNVWVLFEDEVHDDSPVSVMGGLQ